MYTQAITICGISSAICITNIEGFKRNNFVKLPIFKIPFLEIGMYVQSLGYLEYVLPIAREVLELIGIHHDQNEHRVDDDCEPEPVHHLAPDDPR